VPGYQLAKLIKGAGRASLDRLVRQVARHILRHRRRAPVPALRLFLQSLERDRLDIPIYPLCLPAPKNTPLTGIPVGPQRDATGTALPYIILPDKFQSGDSFLTHDLRVTRSIRIIEKVRLNLIGEGFNIFNIANLTGYSGALNAYIRPISTSQTNPKGTPGRSPNLNEFTFGQPNNRVSPIFGTGGPRAFQLAARISF